jgi:hypothetical protein
VDSGYRGGRGAAVGTAVGGGAAALAALAPPRPRVVGRRRAGPEGAELERSRRKKKARPETGGGRMSEARCDGGRAARVRLKKGDGVARSP